MKSSAIIRAILVGATCGCVVGPSYTQPTIPVPQGWSESVAATEPVSLERWWTAFHDPMLESLIERAVQGNLDLKIAAARVREARAARGIAAAAGLPQLDATAAYAVRARTRGGMHFVMP